MNIFGITLRPFTKEDEEILEPNRKAFVGGSLEIPNGYEGENVETVTILNGEGRIIGSLTGTIIIALDPFIKVQGTGRTESLQGLFAACRALEYRGAKHGAREAYIAVPDSLPEYQELVKRVGFQETAQNCKIYRRQM